MPTPHDPMTPDEDAVRRALAAARHADPMPADVAARLGDTLAALTAERGASPVNATSPKTPVSPTPAIPTPAIPSTGEPVGGAVADDVTPTARVIPLRRRVGLLVAAAAVVVAGATAPAWWTDIQNDMSTNAEDHSYGGDAPGRASTESDDQSDSSSSGKTNSGTARDQAEQPTAPGAVSPTSPTHAAAAVLTSGPGLEQEVRGLLTTHASRNDPEHRASLAALPCGSLDDVEFALPVTFDGTPAWLLRSTPEAATASIVTCAGSTLATIPLP